MKVRIEGTPEDCAVAAELIREIRDRLQKSLVGSKHPPIQELVDGATHIYNQEISDMLARIGAVLDEPA